MLANENLIHQPAYRPIVEAFALTALDPEAMQPWNQFSI